MVANGSRVAFFCTNLASGVDVKVLDNVNVFGGHTESLEKEPESISVLRIKGGFRKDIGYMESLAVLPPLLSHHSLDKDAVVGGAKEGLLRAALG